MLLPIYPKCKTTKAWPTHGYWLRADPVSIEAGADAVFMRNMADLQLDAAEQEQILTAINAFLQADGMRIYPLTKSAWYLHSQMLIHCQTPSPQRLSGQMIDAQVFKHKNAQDWRPLFTELQMLLYQHSVNIKRREKGLPEVTALWFWQPSWWQRLLEQLPLIYADNPIACRSD